MRRSITGRCFALRCFIGPGRSASVVAGSLRRRRSPQDPFIGARGASGKRERAGWRLRLIRPTGSSHFNHRRPDKRSAIGQLFRCMPVHRRPDKRSAIGQFVQVQAGAIVGPISVAPSGNCSGACQFNRRPDKRSAIGQLFRCMPVHRRPDKRSAIGQFVPVHASSIVGPISVAPSGNCSGACQCNRRPDKRSAIGQLFRCMPVQS